MVLERIATVSTPITAHGCTLYTISAVINAFAQVCLYLTLNDSLLQLQKKTAESWLLINHNLDSRGKTVT